MKRTAWTLVLLAMLGGCSHKGEADKARGRAAALAQAAAPRAGKTQLPQDEDGGMEPAAATGPELASPALTSGDRNSRDPASTRPETVCQKPAGVASAHPDPAGAVSMPSPPADQVHVFNNNL